MTSRANIKTSMLRSDRAHYTSMVQTYKAQILELEKRLEQARNRIRKIDAKIREAQNGNT